MDANLCYNFAVPGKKEITVGTRIDEETQRKLERIVDLEDRKIGYVVRELMLRGLALYEIDGKLRDAQSERKTTIGMLSKTAKLGGQRPKQKKVNAR